MRFFVAFMAFLYSFALPLFSQADSLAPTRFFQFGLGLTGFNYIGDFTNDVTALYRIHPGGNLSLQTTGSAALQLQANVGFGAFEEQLDRRSDAFSLDATANKFVETSFYYADLRLKFRFLRQKRLQPYVSLGAGILVFSPRDESGKLLREQPETRAAHETYNTSIPQLPGVIGLKAQITPLVAASIDYTYRVTPTDYLDNVGQWGSRQGHDALQALQLSVYFTLRPGKPRVLPVVVPPVDTVLAHRNQVAPPLDSNQLVKEADPEAVVVQVQTPDPVRIEESPAPVPEEVQEEKSAEEQYVEQAQTAIRNKQYVYYQVKEGDDMASIADRFRVQEETIIKINYLRKTPITPGMFLRLPDMGISTEDD